MTWIFICFIILSLISNIYASQFPLKYNAVRAAASDEDSPWVWSSRQRNGRRLKFDDDDNYGDYDDHDHDEHCNHQHHHPHHLHFGPPRHRHYPYTGALEYYRHKPLSYPPLAPFAQSVPLPSAPTTMDFANSPNLFPAPVFEDPQENDDVDDNDRSVTSTTTTTTIKPTTSSSKKTITTTTTTEKPAFENIDLRFGA